MDNIIRVLIVDDQPIIRIGLKTMLERTDDSIKVVATAENGKDAVDKVSEFSPDIVLMDIRMPIMDGIVATKEITKNYKNIKVIALTTFDDDECIRGVLNAGATGYILKDMPSEGLVHAVMTTYSGGTTMSPEIKDKVIQMAGIMNEPVKTVLEPAMERKIILSPRENEVLKLLADGLNNNEISEKLFLSEGTVRNYVSRIYTRLDVRDRTQAVLKAINLGIITADKNN